MQCSARSAPVGASIARPLLAFSLRAYKQPYRILRRAHHLKIHFLIIGHYITSQVYFRTKYSKRAIVQFVLFIIYTVMKMQKYPRIRDLREDADLTQQQVGNAINVPQRIYAYYESGQRMIPSRVLCALADYYGVSVDYILGRTDSDCHRGDSAPTGAK